MEYKNYSITREGYKVEFLGHDYRSVCHNSNAIVILTEWDEYKTLNFEGLRLLMNDKIANFYDMRSFIDMDKVRGCGF